MFSSKYQQTWDTKLLTGYSQVCKELPSFLTALSFMKKFVFAYLKQITFQSLTQINTTKISLETFTMMKQI
jgi:hypothetical protein